MMRLTKGGNCKCRKVNRLVRYLSLVEFFEKKLDPLIRKVYLLLKLNIINSSHSWSRTMAKLPKVDKGLKSGLTNAEKVQKIVLGVALVATLGMGGSFLGEAQANVLGSAVVQESNQSTNQGALLLSPSKIADEGDTVAYHLSHRSHYSHRSHSSHYSSRY